MTSLPATKPAFIFVGDHPAIDFANTLAVNHGQPLELLADWTDLVRWFAESKLSTDASLHLPVDRRAGALRHVAELRAAWKNELASLVDGRRVSDGFIERLNRLMADDTFHSILLRKGKGGLQLSTSASRLGGEKLALALLARQIAQFLSEATLDYLRRCANTDSCVLYFYDTTKNHRRHWCSTATCGNRHKVAEFRKRQETRKPSK